MQNLLWPRDMRLQSSDITKKWREEPFKIKHVRMRRDLLIRRSMLDIMLRITSMDLEKKL